MGLDSIRNEITAMDRARHAPTPIAGSCIACESASAELHDRQRRHARLVGSTTAKKTNPTAVGAVPAKGTSMASAIRVTEVTKRYKLGKNNEVSALRGASVEIESGEMVAIVGPSGSGKSTLMHLIGCLDTPDSGSVYLDGERVDGLRGAALTRVRSRELGFIFQGFNLIPTMNATENVALAAEYAGTPRRDARRRAEELLQLVGLGDRMRHLPSELSGGQQQRVAIARALVNDPAIVLGDEPTGDLDSATSDEIVALMRRLNVETGTTFVLVTHNPEVAAACDRTISMRDGFVADHGLDVCCEEEAERRRSLRTIPVTTLAATAS